MPAQRIYTVLSPHLDDAALSCSLLLAANPGSCITTVFASGPPAVRPLTPWDKAARYFAEGADVMAIRRQEDERGAALLRASSVHLSYWDRQYRNGVYGYDGPSEGELVSAITEDLLRRVPPSAITTWALPLGLGHPDHRLTAEVGLGLARAAAGEVYVYEDLPYALENDAEVAERKHYFRQQGFALDAADGVEIGTDRRLKRAVVACHASQRRSLRRRRRAAVRAAERVWALVPSPAASTRGLPGD